MDIARRGDRNMRRTLNLGIGVGAVAAAVTMVAGVASATSGAPHQAARHAAAVEMVNKHITRAQAVRIAEAKVPNSRAIEVESDDLHDHPVWKVTLRTPHGRVIVDVDKRTGTATIVRGDDGDRHDRGDRHDDGQDHRDGDHGDGDQ
jgi:type II secretory pathway component PulJ